ncbi:MAG TPA: glycosyltransferase family 9 protein [Nitrospira sp.]|nr:glycosyltransferase family 9 protein [Nitrospira sp.]
MTRSLVIVHPGSLGDVLLAVPAMRRLRARSNGREILLVAQESISRLLIACGIINDWMSWEGPAGAGLFSSGVPLPCKLRVWLNRCDIAVAWMDDNEDALRTTFEEFTVAEVRIQSPFSPVLRTRHQSHRFLETLEEPTDDGSLEKFIHVPPSAVEEGIACLERIGIPKGRPFVLVHPGSGSVHKCLDPETMAVIIQRLDQKGLVPVVIEGPADQNVLEHVLKVSNRRVPILRNLDLTTLAGALVQARFFLGHDSGVTHLAALFGVRTVAVFGPTDPDQWAPLGDHVTVVQGAPCLCRSWQAVRQCHEKPCLSVSPLQIIGLLEASGLA